RRLPTGDVETKVWKARARAAGLTRCAHRLRERREHRDVTREGSNERVFREGRKIFAPATGSSAELRSCVLLMALGQLRRRGTIDARRGQVRNGRTSTRHPASIGAPGRNAGMGAR